MSAPFWHRPRFARFVHAYSGTWEHGKYRTRVGGSSDRVERWGSYLEALCARWYEKVPAGYSEDAGTVIPSVSLRKDRDVCPACLEIVEKLRTTLPVRGRPAAGLPA